MRAFSLSLIGLVTVAFGTLASCTREDGSGGTSDALMITSPATLPQGAVGSAYSVQLTASGGAPPYSWRLTGGILPPGLTLSSAGLISGTPTTSGTYGCSIEVNDSAAAADSRGFSITIGATGPSTITLEPSTGPVGGDAYVYAAEPSLPHNSSSTLSCATNAVSAQRSFLYFELGQIPGTAVIQGIQLQITIFSKGGSSTIEVHTIASGGSVFQEDTLTWSNQPSVTNLANNGTPPPAALSTNTIPLSPSIFQAYIGSGLANWRGIRVTATGTNTDFAFRPSEYADASQRPKLIVTYQP